MKRRYVLIFVILAIVAVFIFLVPPSTWIYQLLVYKRAKHDNVQLDFYGKVVEHDGSPISGATIWLDSSKIEPHLNPNQHPIVHETFSRMTDQNGLFSVHGISGTYLQVVGVSKDGYRSDMKVGSFFHFGPSADFRERHHPDPGNPVVFHLWKKGPTEPLIEREIGFRLHVDNSPVTIDLLTGKSQPGRVSSGDLQVALNRPVGLLYPRPPYDWQFEITAINGTILETTDVFLYKAPEAGYQSVYKYAFQSANVPGGADAKKKYYVRGRDGSFFASMDVEVNSNSDNRDEAWGGIRIKYLLNPRGSRNLEPDKSKKLNR
jgi:hypothetical protein